MWNEDILQSLYSGNILLNKNKMIIKPVHLMIFTSIDVFQEQMLHV